MAVQEVLVGGVICVEASWPEERSPFHSSDLASVRWAGEWLSLSLAYGGRMEEALAAVQEAIRNARSLAGQPGFTPETWSALPRAYAAMGATCGVIGEQAEAQNGIAQPRPNGKK